MPARLLEPAALLDPELRAPRAGSVLVEGGRITALPTPEEAARIEAERIAFPGALLAPGLIDLHFHGAIPFPPVHDAAGALTRASSSLLRHGTTSFLATTVALPEPALRELVRAVANAIRSGGLPGAEPIGVHLEGPWINPEAAGAQPARGIRSVDPREVDGVLDAAEGLTRVVTLAPEIPGAAALVQRLGRAGIVPAIGHSLAGADALERAAGDGARHVTHLFNAMGGVHHRERGVAGFALADDRLTCDLICDGAHVHPDLVRVASRAKGDRLVLITDRLELPAGGAPAGADFGAEGLRDDGDAIRTADGRLAGSTLTLDRALRNARDWAGLSLLEAVAAATLRPARVLGIERERGTLRPGARADFVVLDVEGRVRETWVGGQRLFPA